MCVRILATVIRHTNRMFSATHYTVICDRPDLMCHIFPSCLINFAKYANEHQFFFLQILSKTLRILRQIQRDIINLHMSSYQLPLPLVKF